MAKTESNMINIKDRNFKNKLNGIMRVDPKYQSNLYNIVFNIIQKIQKLGDSALIEFVNKFDGIVPRDLEELEKLPGVGHKTASVVVSQGFGIPAFPIDTHIHRLAQRWGLTSGKNVKTTENDLKRLFPKDL